MQGILSASVVTVLYYMLNALNFTGLFLYLLKISENQMFFDVFGVGGYIKRYKEIFFMGSYEIFTGSIIYICLRCE